jgi:hypothetical protein
VTTDTTTAALSVVEQAADRVHGTLHTPSVLRKAAALLSDLWAAGERHGVAPEEWSLTLNVQYVALGVVSRRTAPPTATRSKDKVRQLQRDLVAALAELGVSAVPGRQVVVERLEATPQWGISGQRQLAVGIWTNAGWNLTWDGDATEYSPDIRVIAPATAAGAKEVAELVTAIARGQAPDPFRRDY